MNLKYDIEAYAAKAREAAAEGIVLVRNEGQALPLPAGTRVALFGRSQFNYYKSGTGSGGMVNVRRVLDIPTALGGEDGYLLNESVRSAYEAWLNEHPFEEGSGWAGERWYQDEMPLSEALVQRAAKESEAAIIVIGRTAGEDKDNTDEPGSYQLTGEEKEMLRIVCGSFDRTIVLLNVGNIIDMNWIDETHPGAVLYVWQGGQEGGGAVLDVLTGRVTPSGHLTDTVVRDLLEHPAGTGLVKAGIANGSNYGNELYDLYQEDIYVGYRYFETFCPEKVRYPFGYGLSYTSFDLCCGLIERKQKGIAVSGIVKNTGAYAGKAVVQIYAELPQGQLGQPARRLVGFCKTSLLKPGESEEYGILVGEAELVSYDDSGVTGHRSAYVMEEGTYRFYAGENVRSAVCIGSFDLGGTRVIRQSEEALAPVRAFERLRPNAKMQMSHETVPTRTIDMEQRRLERLPENRPCTGNKGYVLRDVEKGRITLEEFADQLTDEELCTLTRGEGMCSVRVTPGIAGAMGGVSQELLDYGIPTAGCADGPSGIRMDSGTIAVALPSGTCLAATWNERLVEELFEYEGQELRKNRIDTLLGPGMNIRRHPLNGRNFEYFSEDPLITGRMGSAELRGMHRYGVTGTIKHFACNNQETSRRRADAVVSERALREIYLRGFEIAIREGGAYSIMTSYNPVNGDWTAGNYDLNTTILRQDFGFRGIVMTDWWAEANDPGQMESSRTNAARIVSAQNDLYMVCTNPKANSRGDNLKECLREGKLTRGELLRSAENILRYLLRTPAYLWTTGQETEEDHLLQETRKKEESQATKFAKRINITDQGELDPAQISTEKGVRTAIRLARENTELKKYTLELELRAKEGVPPLAQMNVQIMVDSWMLGSDTFTGEDTEWRTVRGVLEMFYIQQSSYYLNVVFSESGLELRSARIIAE